MLDSFSLQNINLKLVASWNAVFQFLETPLCIVEFKVRRISNALSMLRSPIAKQTKDGKA